ncbi:MAG: hypothetical protein AB7E70_19525 [Hyphomicrobiaceae bacterium]
MTDAELEEAKRLCDAAIDGPWETRAVTQLDDAPPGLVVCGSDSDECGEQIADAYDNTMWSDARSTANAAFIAASRQLVPRLITALESARRERDALTQRRDELLVTVRNLSLQTPYPEEAGNTATLIAEVGTLRSECNRLREALIVSQNNESRLRLRLDGVHPSHMPTVIDGLEAERDAWKSNYEEMQRERDTARQQLAAVEADLAKERHQNQTAWKVAAWLESRAAAHEKTLASLPDDEHNREQRDEHGWASSYGSGWAHDIRSGAWRTTKGDAGK